MPSKPHQVPRPQKKKNSLQPIYVKFHLKIYGYQKLANRKTEYKATFFQSITEKKSNEKQTWNEVLEFP
jgi:hypothetical protein